MNTRVFVLLGSLLTLVFGSATASRAGLVTFQVDLSAQIALGNFDPAADTAFVAGNPLNNWSTSESSLTPSAGNPKVWTGTFEIAATAGATVQYKFVLATARGLTWEGNVGTGGGTGNRTFTLAAADQTLPVVFFNNVSSGVTVSGDVTFRVDLSVQATLGNFDPASGTVSVAGEFNGWNTTAFELARSVTEPNLWTGTVKLSGAAGSAVSYKFVLNGGTWEGNVGPGGSQNRSLDLRNGPQTLPVVFFNNLAAAPVSVPLTFQVNVGVLAAQGRFDPDSDTVFVAGDPLNSWNPSASALTRSATDPNLWTGTFDVTGSAGAAVAFKFVVSGTTWESIDNRIYTLPDTSAQTLPLCFFNNVADLGGLAVAPQGADRLRLTWTAGPRIRLQTAAELRNPVWRDVPDTVGAEAATVTTTSGSAYFRLTGP